MRTGILYIESNDCQEGKSLDHFQSFLMQQQGLDSLALVDCFQPMNKQESD